MPRRHERRTRALARPLGDGPGRCWMDAQGNIGLEGQPPFANIWVAVAQAQNRGGGGGGGRREGILSSYDKTGIAVFGY